MTSVFSRTAKTVRSLSIACALFVLLSALTFPEPAQVINPYPAATDNFGNYVAIWNNRLVVGTTSDDPQGISQAGTVYVYQRQPGGAWALSTELHPLDAAANDWFGSVATDGNFIVAGASRKAGNIGAAYIFELRSGAWVQVAKLLPDAPTANCSDPNGYCHLFGVSAAIEGNVVVIGAPTEAARCGAVYVFRRSLDGTQWNREARLTPTDSSPDQQFGQSVRIHNGRIASGANNLGNGAAYLFTRQGQTWTQEAKLTAADGAQYDNFGFSVDIDADRALVGAYRANVTSGLRGGAAYVFERNAQNEWPQVAKLVASDGTPGSPDIGGEGEQFGYQVRWHNGEAYVSRYPGVYSSPTKVRTAAVYRFRQTTPDVWQEIKQFTPTTVIPGDGFAYYMDSHRETFVVGAPYEGDAPPSEIHQRGSVFVYDLAPTDRIFTDWFEER